MAELTDADLCAALPTVSRELDIRLPSHWLSAVAERALTGTPADRRQFLYAAAHLTSPREREIASEAMASGLRVRVEQLRAEVAGNAAIIASMSPPPAPRPPGEVIQLDDYRAAVCG